MILIKVSLIINYYKLTNVIYKLKINNNIIIVIYYIYL